jgi:hypothetical protein
MVQLWKSLNSKMPWKKQPSKHVTIGNLRIFKDKQGVFEIDAYSPDPKAYNVINSKDPKFSIMVHGIELALRILEHNAGRNTLVKTASNIIRVREELKKNTNPEQKKLEKHIFSLPKDINQLEPTIEACIEK